MKVSAEQLSRLLSHALRHDPGRYDLELDPEGWVPVDQALAAVHRRGPQWSDVTEADLAAMIATSAKRRHELSEGRIRALYGHSVPGRVEKTEEVPPPLLFHGTSPRAWAAIQESGLRPMGRQSVHLAVDVATAESVGRREAPAPVVLTVDTAKAVASGSRFWRGNDDVWLSDHVAPDCLAVRQS